MFCVTFPTYINTIILIPTYYKCAVLSDETVLLDLKHLLIEAKQKIPPFLIAIQPDNEKYLDIGGKFSLHFVCIIVLILL